MRDAWRLQLKGNIVVVDEGHNLLDSIANMHSVQVDLDLFVVCLSQLRDYVDRYQSRFNHISIANNRLLLSLIGNIVQLGQRFQKSCVYTIADFKINVGTVFT